MKSFADTGLVLRRTKHLEHDVRLTMLLKHQGKFSLVLKGSASPTSKLKSLQEPFSELDVQIHAPIHGTHGRLTGGKLLHSFERIRMSYEAYVVASACCEVVDMLVPFRAPSPEVFDILRDAFSRLESSPHAPEEWVVFVQRFLKTLGHGDISDKLKNNSLDRQWDIATLELEHILPWRMKTDFSSLRQQPVV